MIEIKQKFVLVGNDGLYFGTYDSAEYVYDNEKNPCAVLVSLNEKWGLVDLDGSVKVPVTYMFAKRISNGMILFRSIISKCGLYDAILKRWALKNICDDYDLIVEHPFNNDLVIVFKGSKRGIFNTKICNWTLLPEYDCIHSGFDTIETEFGLSYAFLDVDGNVLFTVIYGYSKELDKSVKRVINSALNGYTITDYFDKTFKI